jgi:hypothetical protein
VCRQSPIHYCTSVLQACSVLKCEGFVLQRRSQISLQLGSLWHSKGYLTPHKTELNGTETKLRGKLSHE